METGSTLVRECEVATRVGDGVGDGDEDGEDDGEGDGVGAGGSGMGVAAVTGVSVEACS